MGKPLRSERKGLAGAGFLVLALDRIDCVNVVHVLAIQHDIRVAHGLAY